jgi:hypothetical protein
VEGQYPLLILATLTSVLMISGCTIPTIDMGDSGSGDNLVKTYKWRHKGRTYTWEIPIPSSLYEHYRRQPRSPEYERYVADVRDDEYLALLCSKLEEVEVKCDWSGKIDFVLSFVQSLEYTDDNLTGFDEYPRYPVETLVDEGGDCEDTSILFVSIVRELGYGVALLRFNEAEHMAAGVSVSGDVVSKWSKGYTLTYYEKDGKCFAYCETTGSGWRIGEKPDWVGDEGAVVIQV